MAVPVVGEVLLDTNIFSGYLRAGLHAEWMCGRVSNTIRFLSATVLMELLLGADTSRRKRAVDGIRRAFPPRKAKRDEGTTHALHLNHDVILMR